MLLQQLGVFFVDLVKQREVEELVGGDVVSGRRKGLQVLLDQVVTDREESVLSGLIGLHKKLVLRRGLSDFLLEIEAEVLAVDVHSELGAAFGVGEGILPPENLRVQERLECVALVSIDS